MDLCRNSGRIGILPENRTSAYERFLQFPEGEQKAFFEWVYAAKPDETKVKRIAATIEKSLNTKH